MNAGIRVVLGQRRFGHTGISNLRKNLKTPSTLEISTYVVGKASWKRRSTLQNEETMEPFTRNRAEMNLSQKEERGWTGKMSSSAPTKAWNNLSVEMKTCATIQQLKNKLKQSIFNSN